MATDDPVRRREDEEGGDGSDADLSNNPLQDSTNSKGMDQINTFDGESNSEAGVGGFEGPVFDSDVDGRSYDPNSDYLPTELAGPAGQVKRYGLADSDFQTKLKQSEKYLDPIDRDRLKSIDNDRKALDNVLSKTSDLEGLLLDRSNVERLLQQKGLPVQTAIFLSSLLSNENSWLFQNQSSISGNLDSEIARKEALKKLEKLAESSKTSLQNSLSIERYERNKRLNEALAITIKSGDSQKLTDKSLDKGPADFQKFLDNYVVSRNDILKERIDLSQKQKDLEAKIKDADPNTKKALQGELKTIVDRINGIDSNVTDYRLSMRMGESETDYVKRLQESFLQEKQGLQTVITNLNNDLEDLKTQTPKDNKRIELIKKQIEKYEKRLTLAEHASRTTTQYFAAGEYNKNGKRILPDTVINPLGDKTKREFEINSTFGWDGYGRAENEIYNAITGSPHGGIDARVPIGTQVNNIVNGMVLNHKTTIGADVLVLQPQSDKLREAGIAYRESVNNPDGSISPAGYYKEGESIPMDRATLLKVDPKLPDSPYKKVGVLYDPKLGFYRTGFDSNLNKVPIQLTDSEIASLPENVKNHPESLNHAGNSITIQTNVMGGVYEVTYMHLDKPSPLIGQGQVNAGDTIGQVGTTGSSTGPHLHIGVISKTEPNIPPNFYQPVIGNNGKVTHYLVNPDYFMRVMLPQGSK